ncbi:MAG TPA: SPOR domain-containing protein [Caulobacteraceae bacterium]|jgi:D-alanyl-D-alanine carboxypeptidase (penicillin-binding protein 5/6)
MGSPARRLIVSVVATALAFTSLASAAEAKARHKHTGGALPSFLHFTSQPKYAAIVVDAKTGEVLYEQNPDAHRYPASITKIMTMYLAFEALADHRLSFDDRLVISPHAAAQAPSKVGLRAGQSISVRDAMDAIAVLSANDMAVALAEKLGGTEAHFAELMTAKAKQLGMANTQYVNANGLPDNRQLTSARDISILSRAVLRDYPQYYSFFSTRQFTYLGRTTKNHNHLLGSMPGVDGIKTGFTNASGFNLAASAVRDDRRLIAVVMGGSSTAARDLHVEDLLDAGFTVIKKRELGQQTTIAQNLREPLPVGAVDRAPTEQGDGDEAGVHIVVDGKAGRVHQTFNAKADDASAACTMKRVRVHHKLVRRCIIPASDTRLQSTSARTIKADVAKAETGGGWLVQLGAYKSPAQARAQLAKMTSKFSGALSASGGGRVDHSSGNYRVRFAGLSADQASKACDTIKAQGQACMALRP